MRHRSLFAAAVIALAIAATAPAGIIPPPGKGDNFVLKSAGLRYSGDGRLADAGDVQAGCGTKGWRAIGGGGGVSAPTAFTFLWSLRPVDFNDPDEARDEGWQVIGEGEAGTVATAVAICIRKAKLRYREKHLPGSSTTDLRTAKVRCGGRGFHVTAGGVFAGSGGGSFVSSSYPYDGGDRDRRPDDGWVGKVLDTGAAGFDVHAICMRGARVQYRRGKPATIGTNSSLTRTMACGKRGHAIGGGARITGFINRGRITDTHPHDGQDGGAAPDDGWRTTAYNLSSGAPSDLIPFAICLR